MDLARKRITPEQIITMLREAEVPLNQATPIGEVCRGKKDKPWPPVTYGMTFPTANRVNS